MIERYILYGVVALAILGVTWFHGYTRGEIKLFEFKAELAAAAVVVVKKIELLKETVRVPYVKREVEIQKVFVTIEKEVSRVPSRTACFVTAGWMRVHDAAAGGDRRPEGALDDPADTGVTEAQAHAVVTANYRSFHEVKNDLIACRGFVAGLPDVVKK